MVFQFIAQGEIKTREFEGINTLIERIHKIEHLIYSEIIRYICNDQISLQSNQVIFSGINTTKSIIYNKYEL